MLTKQEEGVKKKKWCEEKRGKRREEAVMEKRGGTQEEVLWEGSKMEACVAWRGGSRVE